MKQNEVKDYEWKDEFDNFTFREVLSMYVSDCIEYLEGEVPNAGPEWMEDEIIYAMKIIKDACMDQAGLGSLDWRSQYLEETEE